MICLFFLYENEKLFVQSLIVTLKGLISNYSAKNVTKINDVTYPNLKVWPIINMKASSIQGYFWKKLTY